MNDMPNLFRCPCSACVEFRASKAQPRTVVYFGENRPAWHVPLTPEHKRYSAALKALSYSHPKASSEQLLTTERREEWRAFMDQMPDVTERAMARGIAL